MSKSTSHLPGTSEVQPIMDKGKKLCFQIKTRTSLLRSQRLPRNNGATTWWQRGGLITALGLKLLCRSATTCVIVKKSLCCRCTTSKGFCGANLLLTRLMRTYHCSPINFTGEVFCGGIQTQQSYIGIWFYHKKKKYYLIKRTLPSFVLFSIILLAGVTKLLPRDKNTTGEE